MAYILKALLERGHKLAEGLGVVGVAREDLVADRHTI